MKQTMILRSLFAVTLLFGSMYARHAFDSDVTNKSVSSADSRTFCAPFAFKAKQVSVSWPLNADPVPPSVACLCPQAIPGTTISHRGANAEPSIAVDPTNPCRLCVVWQNDRFRRGGGSLEAGIAYSTDGGLTWKNSLVPFQICIGGITQRVSDVWLSWSIDGKRLYLNALPFNSTFVPASGSVQSGVATSVSLDGGATWSTPVFNITSCNFNNEPTGECPIDDKNSVTADPLNPLFAYSVWDRFENLSNFHSETFLSRTTDGGVTWSTGVSIYNANTDPDFVGLSNGDPMDNGTIGNIVVRLPQTKGGDLLNFAVRYYATPNATNNDFINDFFPYQFTLTDLILIRSSNNGLTWTPAATVIAADPVQINAAVFTGGFNIVAGDIVNGIGASMRTMNDGDGASTTGGDGLSVAVNSVNGNLYVVWQSAIFTTPGNQLPLIALSTSRDGGFTWSDAALVSRTPLTAPNPQAFTPAIAVTKNGYVGVLYSDFRNDTTPANSGIVSDATLSDTWLAIYKEVPSATGGSTGIGLDFVTELRLSKQSYIAQNGPDTGIAGIMTNGDYSFLVADALNFYAAYTIPITPADTPVLICVDPEVEGTVLLDHNRQDTFVSVVQTCP